MSELARIGVEVQLRAATDLLDMACGRGGPGIWVAAHTGASLVGVDIAAGAVAAADARAKEAGLSSAEFQVGAFDDSGLPDVSVDAAMCVDALLFAPDKAAALREFARVLRPGGRLVVTTWDYHTQPRGRPPQVPDHRPMLADAGFETIAGRLAEHSGGIRNRAPRERVRSSLGRFVIDAAWNARDRRGRD